MVEPVKQTHYSSSGGGDLMGISAFKELTVRNRLMTARDLDSNHPPIRNSHYKVSNMLDCLLRLLARACLACGAHK